VARDWPVWRCQRLPKVTWQQRRIGSDARGWFTPHRQSEYWLDNWPACGRWLKRRRPNEPTAPSVEIVEIVVATEDLMCLPIMPSKRIGDAGRVGLCRRGADRRPDRLQTTRHGRMVGSSVAVPDLNLPGSGCLENDVPQCVAISSKITREKDIAPYLYQDLCSRWLGRRPDLGDLSVPCGRWM
jgi:hypothetical protein